MRKIVCVLGLGLALGCTNNSQITAVNGTGGSGGRKGGDTPDAFFVVPDANFTGPGAGGRTGGGPDAGPFQGGISRPCENLECRQTGCLMGACQQKACAAGTRTTLRGRVYDPAGKVPLYNVVVYVPNAPLADITTGPSCERCDSPVSGKPIAAALTDTHGDFVLDNVPVGADVPLVLQIGKWRRQISLPSIAACTETRIDDPNVLRLPRNQKEGHLPRIALTTGGADRLECLLRKIGIEESEFTPEAGMGRVNFYAGKSSQPFTTATLSYAPTLNGGAAFSPAIPFWSDAANFDKYDIVILSCEGAQFPQDKSQAALAGLQAYANKGGRVFASHWHNVWLQNGPAPWPNVATWVRQGNLPDPFTSNIDTSFPKGEALADWLVNVQASTTKGQLTINEGKHTAQATTPMLSRQWIHSDMPEAVQYFTFNTPVEAPVGMECGRLVFTDIHVSAQDVAGKPYPMGCVSPELSPQEKALEFMLFDLSSCVQPDTAPPQPPIP